MMMLIEQEKLDLQKKETEMSVYLATTWYPRGELPRFSRMLPVLEAKYGGIVIAFLPSDDGLAVLSHFTSGEYKNHPGIVFTLNDDPKRGRYLAITKALEAGAQFIHYADMDRLLHWVETRRDEWEQMVTEIGKYDCIIFGRTPQAYSTHPQALKVTEMVSNRVVSYFMKREMDVSAGSKSFSRQAAQYLIDFGSPENSIGTDAEWPMLLSQAGFHLEYKRVDGLDWESADQYRLQAATGDIQAQVAAEFDADPENWLHRVEIADHIVQAALRASQWRHPMAKVEGSTQQEFDFEAVFEVDDYLYFYHEALTDERTDKEVSALVSLLGLDELKKILDLACGFGRHTNRLAALGHQMTGVDLSDGFLEIARKDALQRGVKVNYLQGDMRDITFDNEFDCVLLLFTAFGYFSDEENLRVLINARNALKPGGCVIFDTPNRDTHLKTIQPFYVHEKDGDMMIDRMSFDSLQGRSINRRIVVRNGARKEKPFSIRFYNPTELVMVVKQAGLVLEHIYGGWDASDLTSESRRLIVVARKPG